MKKFIASKILIVDGEPSPCECDENIICAYCVQANLMVWERKEQPQEKIKKDLLKIAQKIGIRKSGTLTGIPIGTLSIWINKGNCPEKYIEKLQVLKEVAT